MGHQPIRHKKQQDWAYFRLLLSLLWNLRRDIFSISFAGFHTSAHTLFSKLTYILRAFALPFKIVFLYRPPHKYDPWQSSLFYTEFTEIEFYSISVKPMHKLYLEILIKLFTEPNKLFTLPLKNTLQHPILYKIISREPIKYELVD